MSGLKLVFVLAAGISLSACAGPTEFKIASLAPDMPATGAAARAPSNTVAVEGADKMNVSVQPLTQLCQGLTYHIAYSDQATKSIKEALSSVRIGIGAPKNLTVTVDDFNVRTMCLFNAPFEMRTDVDVRLVLEARDADSQGAPPWRGAAEIYREGEKTASDAENMPQAISQTIKDVMGETLSRLVEDMKSAKPTVTSQAN